ncbi:MAG: CoA-binding protein [Thermodesulfobacteriota bacterium]
MIEKIEESPLFKMVNPESIAFFGASNNFAAMGTNMLSSLMALGFPGRIYPVHPKEETVRGLAAYKSVADLPEAPDLAVIVLPTRLVIQTMEECGKKGVKTAIVITAGFREKGEEGAAEEKKLWDVARKYGIRFLGPNCIGATNLHAKLNTTFMRAEGSPGGIGFASQSGSFVTQMFNYLARFGTGFSTAFSVGNAADVDLIDCIEYLGACPHTKVIGMYVEGIRRGREFVALCREVVRKKPIVALYVGGSKTGRRASLSHTGTLAGPDKLYDGIFRQAGVLRARSVDEMFDICRAFCSLPLPAGNAIAIQTHSGGPGTVAADACGRAGLSVPDFSAQTAERLSEFVPSTGSLANPVDITYSKNPESFFSAIPEALLADPGIHMLLVYYLVPNAMVESPLRRMGLSDGDAAEAARSWLDNQAGAIAALMEKSKKPVAGFTFRGIMEQFPQALMARGIPVFPGPERAVAALAGMVRYRRFRERIELAARARG